MTTTSPASLDGEDYSIRGGAFRSADGSSLTLVLVNRDGIAQEVDLLGLAGYMPIGAQLLTSTGPLGETIDIASLLAGPNGSYSLPGLSIAIVQFQAVPEPASGISLLLVASLMLATGYARTGQRRRSRGSKEICLNLHSHANHSSAVIA